MGSPLTSHLKIIALIFSDGYVESLVTAQLNQEGVHVYVAKVRPLMKIKTVEGRLRKGVLRSLVYS